MHTATLPAQSIERISFFANATLLMAILVLWIARPAWWNGIALTLLVSG